MLWSPIVKNQVGAKFNQTDDIAKIKNEISTRFGVDLQIVCNQDYMDCINKLRDYARTETKELKSPVLRLFQIEEKLTKHLKKLSWLLYHDSERLDQLVWVLLNDKASF